MSAVSQVEKRYVSSSLSHELRKDAAVNPAAILDTRHSTRHRWFLSLSRFCCISLIFHHCSRIFFTVSLRTLRVCPVKTNGAAGSSRSSRTSPRRWKVEAGLCCLSAVVSRLSTTTHRHHSLRSPFTRRLAFALQRTRHVRPAADSAPHPGAGLRRLLHRHRGGGYGPGSRKHSGQSRYRHTRHDHTNMAKKTSTVQIS